MERQFKLQARSMSVGYRGQAIVTDAEFSVRPGEILTLIGPNGAGKTTILKSIAGQLALLGGTVYLDGADLLSLPPRETAKKLSLLLTERPAAEKMTCREVVSAGRYPYTGLLGILSPEDRRRVTETMAQAGVLELAERRFDSVSDGQRQRVLLARAICQEPEVLILDEPTSYLDIRHKLELITTLKTMVRQRSLAVVLSLHELDLAQRCSDTLLCLKDGVVDRCGPPEEIFSGGYIARLYGLPPGCCDERYGTVELPAPAGAPQVFVLGGCGLGVPVYRRLQRQGVPFAAGILWENDGDYLTASALAAQVVSLPFGAAVDDGALAEAKALIDRCQSVICALPPERMTGAAAPLRTLADYARTQNKL